MSCSVCKSDTAWNVWTLAFTSFAGARNSASGSDFLSALTPRPGLLKIEICLDCPAIRPCQEFTEEEQKQMEELVKQQEKAGKTTFKKEGP